MFGVTTRSGGLYLLVPCVCICLLFFGCSRMEKQQTVKKLPRSSQTTCVVKETRDNPWKQVDLNQLRGNGLIIDKNPNSQYYSTLKITRADMVYFTLAAMNIPLKKYDGRIDDIGLKAWYADFIGTAAEKGYISHMLEGKTFNPDSTVTRQEFAVFIMKVRDSLYKPVKTDKNSVQINDLDRISGDAKESVQCAVSMGLFELDNSDCFNPQDNVKGFELSKVIGNLTKSENAPVIDIVKLVETAFIEGKSEVSIPEGKYIIALGENGAHLLFQNLKGKEGHPFTIDATGVELVCQDYRSTAVRFVNCSNIIFKGATIGYIRPTMTQGTVTSISYDGRSIEALLDKGYPPIDSLSPTAYVFNKNTLKMKNGCPDLYAISCEDLGDRRYRIGYDFDVRKGNLSVGDILGFRTEGSFNTQLINCEKVTISNCSMTDGMFGIHESGGYGANIYDGDTVTFREKPEGASRDRVLSTYADAFHSDCVRMGPTITNCRFEGMGDDCFNIHGTYAMLMEKTGKGEYIIGTDGTQLFDRQGDRMRIQDISGNLFGETVIKEVKQTDISSYVIPGGIEELHKINGNFTPQRFIKIKTIDDIDIQFGAMISNPDMGGKGFRIVNNTFGSNRARGILIKADDGIVEGNTFLGNSMSSILIAPEFYWNEAGYVRNLTIRNNVFKKSGFVQGYMPAILIDGEGGREGGIAHRNIIIENNTFEGNYGDSLSIRYVDGLIIRGNRFLDRNATASETRGGFEHIRIEDSKNVEIFNNEFKGTMKTVTDGGNTEFKRLEKNSDTVTN